MTAPHFAHGLSTNPSSQRAQTEALAALERGLGPRRPDLLVVFATHHHGTALESIGPRLAEACGASVVLGCTGEGIIGGAREIEQEPAIALWAAHLPDTRLAPFEVSAEQAEDGSLRFSGLPELREPERASLLLLGEPYSFPMDDYLGLLNERFPGVPAIGGMASGGSGPGQNLLITRSGLREGGAIGLVVEGAVELRSVVSQGCRPVGKPMVVTACEENTIQKLSGKPAADALMETLSALDPSEQEIFRHGPFVGLAVDPRKSVFERGDFIVRAIVGIKPQERSFAVNDLVRRGQTVQFLVRDAASASDDLRLLLQAHAPARDPASAAGARAEAQTSGALLFSCNGRGSRMFEVADHDAGCVRSVLGADLPVAGFFAMGEIGPVGGRNFLHGFTASVALFRERAR